MLSHANAALMSRRRCVRALSVDLKGIKGVLAMLTDLALGGRWPDLARDMRRLQEEMNRTFGGFRFAVPAEYPPVNVWAGADGAIITAEIPGVAPDQIDITVHQDLSLIHISEPTRLLS